MKAHYATPLRLAFLTLVTLTLLNIGHAVPIVGYAGGGANTVFHDVRELSNGTVLIAGVADNLDWLPADTEVMELTVTGLPAPTGARVPFMLQLAGGGGEILRAVRLPSGAADNIRWMKTTEVPGETTGALYVSGNVAGGYFIGRLDGNFVVAPPSGFLWTHVESAADGHETDQPWDVGSDGRVVFAQGGESSATIRFLDAVGNLVGLPQLRASHFVDGTYERGVGEAFPQADHSAIRLPTDVQSWDDAGLFFVGPDGNGNLRQGSWPLDIMITHSFDTNTPLNEINGRFYGYNGYKTAGRHWIGAVTVDRRSNDFIFGFNVKSVFWDAPANKEQPDFEPAVIAYDATGQLKWWSRLYTEAKDSNGDGQIDTTYVSPPDQYIDGLAVDYSVPLAAGGAVVVVARTHGNNTSNFWPGNDIALNPAAVGFQNRFTGNEGNIHLSWIGKLRATDGNLLAASYLGGYFRRIMGSRGNWPTAAYPEPIHDAWPNHNFGWPDLTTTRIAPNALSIGPDGRAHMVGRGPRMVTTANAWQNLPRRLGHNNPVLNEGTSPWNNWVRAYEPDLSALAYSSALTGVWEYPDGDIDAEPTGADNTQLRGVFPTSGGVFVVGYHGNSAATAAAGNNIPVNAVPAWGGSAYNGITGIFALLSFGDNNRPLPEISASVTGGVLSAEAAGLSGASPAVSWEWDFGDGMAGLGASVTHAYGEPGRYLVGLKVTNADGISAYTHQWVDVAEAGPVHQRRGLWTTSGRIAHIRQQIQSEPAGHHARTYALLKQRIDDNFDRIIFNPDPASSNWNYSRSFLAQQAAAAALFADLPSQRAYYAQIAYAALAEMYNNPDSGGNLLTGSNSHLSKATIAMGFAVAYELAAPFWSTEQRDWVRDMMYAALDAWPSLTHQNFGSPHSSNWIGVVRGAEMQMMLAIGEEAARPARYTALRGWLLSHAQTLGLLGWGQEGNYYLSYAETYTLPAHIALANLGDAEIKAGLSAARHHMVPIFSALGGESTPHVVNWGVGNADFEGGFASLLMGIAPAGERPYLRWWFDRFMGVESGLPDGEIFDAKRQGRVWALLFYPDEVTPLDPASVYPVAIGEAGGYWMRQRWDRDGVIAYLGADSVYWSKGWDAPDALSLVVLGHGQRYISGAGNSAHTAGAKDLFSKVLVNDAVPPLAGRGALVELRTGADGAYAIASGNTAYANLGVSKAHRHLLSDFSGDSGEDALIAVFDRMESSAGSNQYRWQINTGSMGLTVGSDAGRPSFTLTAPGSDSHLRGWVVHPADAVLETTAGRLFFNVDAVNTDFWVVLAVGTGEAPSAAISGSGLASQFALNGVNVTFNNGTERLSNSALTLHAPLEAQFSATPAGGASPLPVAFNAASTSGVQGSATYRWDFGDGHTATGVNPTHTFAQPGVYRVNLFVEDGSGRRDVTSRTVAVDTRWPTASFTVSPSSGQPPLEVTFNPSGTVHPGGLSLTYEWDLGDGTTFTTDNNQSFTHTYAAGAFTPRLIVQDAQGRFDVAERSVSSANRAPTASFTHSHGGGAVPLTVSFDGSASSDPDGDEITFSWNFGDGNFGTGPAPVHTYTQSGDYNVTLTVTDAFGATGSRSILWPISVRDYINPHAPIDPATLPGALLRGVEYSQHTTLVNNASQFFDNMDVLTVAQRGIINRFDIWNRVRTELLGYRFRGYLDVPEDGVYTFYTQMEAGASVTIAGQELYRVISQVNPRFRWAAIPLEAGLHPIEVIHYFRLQSQGTQVPSLDVSWSGPGFGRQVIDPDRLYWLPGRLIADFVYGVQPGSTGTPVAHSFDAAISQAFEGETITQYQWEFPGGVLKTGRFVQHDLAPGSHRVLLTVTTYGGKSALTSKDIEVVAPEPFIAFGGWDRALWPGKTITASDEFLPLSKEAAFDGDKFTRWLGRTGPDSWIQVEFAHDGLPTPFVLNEYRITNHDQHNHRDPQSWNLYGSNDGENWVLLDAVTGNTFTGLRTTNVFPLPGNSAAYSIYRFGEMNAVSSTEDIQLALIQLIDYGQGNQPPSMPPEAALTAPETMILAGQTVTFDASASIDPDGYPMYYEWDFGDGFGASGWELNQVSHTYYSQGLYQTTVTVTDGLRDQDTTSATISVAPAIIAAPVPVFTISPETGQGLTVFTFDATGSFHPDDADLSFEWEFGDGTTEYGPVVVRSMAVGEYTPRLIVRYDRGGYAETYRALSVAMPPDLPAMIGLNLFGSRDERYDFLHANEIAGLLPQAFWNNFRPRNNDAINPPVNSMNIANLRDSSGLSTGTSVEVTNLTQRVNGTVPRSADHRLMRGALSSVLDVRDVPYPEYDVYVYLGCWHGDTAVRSISVSSDNFSSTVYIRQDAPVWRGTHALASATTEAAAVDGPDVAVFRGITDRDFRIATATGAAAYANAIQIVDASGLAESLPLIVAQPQPFETFPTSTASFSVEAIGGFPMTYQWRHDGVPLANGGNIAGADLATLTINGVTTDDAGEYDVVVTNPWGFATSGKALLIVTALTAPSIVEVTGGGVYDLGGSAILTASTTGSQPMELQWYHEGAPLADGPHISGSATAELTLSGLGADRVGSYTVVATNPAGFDESTPVFITINLPPQITVVRPLGGFARIPAGVGAWLETHVTDDGAGPITLQWSLAEGQGSVAFTDPTAPATGVVFDQPGSHRLRLTADDGSLIASLDIIVDYAPPPDSGGQDIDHVLWGTDHNLDRMQDFRNFASRVSDIDLGLGEPGANDSIGSLTLRSVELPLLDAGGFDNPARHTLYAFSALRADASPVGMNGIRWFGPDQDLSFIASRIAFLIAFEAPNFLAPDEQVINLSGAGVILSANLSKNDGGGEVRWAIRQYGQWYASSVFHTGTGVFTTEGFGGVLWAPFNPAELSNTFAGSSALWVRDRVFEPLAATKVDAVGIITNSFSEGDTSRAIRLITFSARTSGDANLGPMIEWTLPGSATVGAPAPFSANVTDDGLPENPGSVALNWWTSDAAAVWSDPATASTTATFAASGPQTVRLSADDGAVATFLQAVLSVDGGGSPIAYDAWMGAYAADIPAERRGPLFDHSGDGLANGLAFAFALDPRVMNTAHLPVVGKVQGTGPEAGQIFLTIAYRQRVGATGNAGAGFVIDGITYFPEFSATLAESSWQNGGHLFEEIGPRTDNGDGSETVTLRLRQPVASAAPQFLRLRVEVQP